MAALVGITVERDLGLAAVGHELPAVERVVRFKAGFFRGEGSGPSTESVPSRRRCVRPDQHECRSKPDSVQNVIACAPATIAGRQDIRHSSCGQHAVIGSIGYLRPFIAVHQDHLGRLVAGGDDQYHGHPEVRQHVEPEHAAKARRAAFLPGSIGRCGSGSRGRRAWPGCSLRLPAASSRHAAASRRPASRSSARRAIPTSVTRSAAMKIPLPGTITEGSVSMSSEPRKKLIDERHGGGAGDVAAFIRLGGRCERSRRCAECLVHVREQEVCTSGNVKTRTEPAITSPKYDQMHAPDQAGAAGPSREAGGPPA